ncbi:MAG: hypothetical protein ABJD97_02950, partial [Betaproteobacteria bacterium]
DAIQEALGRIESRLNAQRTDVDPRSREFKVYSQWGEDGIIEYLVSQVPVESKSFVEFGVENYTEANTIFLLKHRNWRGLVIDGSPEHIESVRRGQVLWRHDLMADCSFITTDNINDIIRRNGFAGELGLLSVDIDGNDYWVWQAIDCVQPRIVIAEYNSLFGSTAAISTPYRADFYRTNADPSNMYYGASIAALTHLAALKGYTLVAGNSAGNNVFYVRNDCLGALRPQTIAEAYVPAAFREARGATGEVLHLSFAQRQGAIGHLPVVDVVTGKLGPLKEAL